MNVINICVYREHHTGNSVPYFLRIVGEFSNIPEAYVCTEGLSDGVFGLSSLSEKTKESNHLIM